ncbi:ring-cleaving dioxygenase [Bacillus cereus]|uniref:ring-cleaving dioxygenase n=1 Tax=Bacillus cereus group TaxID=86661 RepID=UPI001BCE1E70|nr:ring-cleaving dioxygenase [Bacillus toyonensis]MDA1759045.1 ring-cleaving dioxygenase [Bacillus cereus]
MYTIPGHHHISMVTKDAKTNNDFYQKVLGLRRVKKTVNQDNPFMYHLFYGDLTGSAGTELSFFEMRNVGRTIRGTNAITQIGLLVPSLESLTFWKERFESFHVTHGEITTYAGRDALHFEDPDGLRLVLLNNNGEKVPEYWAAWDESSVEKNYRILGMGTVEMTVRDLNKLSQTLTDLFGYKVVSSSNDKAIYQSVPGQSFGEILVKRQEGENERPGKGSIHHLAIRVKNDEELNYWNEAVKEKGFETTGVIDRFYFKSLYFRESNGILFEIATDGPGFTIDSAVEELGENLDLPPFLEERRQEIEEKLIALD